MARGETLFPVLKNEIRAVRTALWFRPAAFCIAAGLVAAMLGTVDSLAPSGSLAWLPEVEVAAVTDMLKLLASGMVTVATVTLSVLMLVLSMAAGQVSPRAVPELMADPVTQNALGTFLATFVYALAALLMIGFGAVGGHGGITLVFLGALLLALNALRYMVQWIHHVAEILKINRMIHRIHGHATEVLESYLRGRTPARCGAFSGGAPTAKVQPKSTGYVELIDDHRLHHLACDHDLAVSLCVQEGDFVHPHMDLMLLHGRKPGEDTLNALRMTVVIGFDRSHEGDPRLGFELLAEIACRALSPGINDPQSALACVHYLDSLLTLAAACPPDSYPGDRSEDGRLAFVRTDFTDMLHRAFRPVMRDAAGHAEVLLAIVETLRGLAREAAPEYLDSLIEEARRAEDLGQASLQLDADKRTLCRIGGELREIAARRRQRPDQGRMELPLAIHPTL